MTGLFETLGLAESAELLSLSAPGWGGNLLRGLANSLQIAFGAYGLGLLIGLFGLMANFMVGRSRATFSPFTPR